MNNNSNTSYGILVLLTKYMPADDVELMQRTCELRTIRTYKLPIKGQKIIHLTGFTFSLHTKVSSDSIKVVTVYIGIDPGLEHHVMNVSEHLCIQH